MLLSIGDFQGTIGIASVFEDEKGEFAKIISTHLNISDLRIEAWWLKFLFLVGYREKVFKNSKPLQFPTIIRKKEIFHEYLPDVNVAIVTVGL